VDFSFIGIFLMFSQYVIMNNSCADLCRKAQCLTKDSAEKIRLVNGVVQ